MTLLARLTQPAVRAPADARALRDAYNAFRRRERYCPFCGSVSPPCEHVAMVKRLVADVAALARRPGGGI